MQQDRMSRTAKSAALTLGLTPIMILLSGCGLGAPGKSVASPTTITGAIKGANGSVHGGQNPVSASTIQLYEVGTTGYTAGKAKPLIPASAQTSVQVGSISVSSGGSSYTSAPSIAITGGGGNGAAAPAAITSGVVSSITVTAGGTGYTSTPTVTFNGGGGTGATATASVVGMNNALTDQNGNFLITGDYTCDTGSYVYITASGGNPGGGTNSNLALMTALGPCATLTSSTYVSINEITTVAAAYALAQFAYNTSFGNTLVSQPGSSSSAPADNFATSSTNTQGVANAMAIANIIASSSNGISPGNNANGTATVEWWTVNTLADILAACVNSTGNTGSSSNCGTLFANVKIPSGTNPATGTAYVAPADTIQAAVYMALNPVLTSTQITNLYNLIPPSGIPFQPYATSATTIHDLTVAVAYNPVIPGSSASTGANTLVFEPTNMVFDKNGNTWIANEVNEANEFSGTCTAAGQTGCNGWLVELDPTGNPIPAGSTSVGGTALNNYLITSYSIGNSSTATTFVGHSDGSGNPPMGIAVDTNNNVWVTDYSNNNLMVVPGSGAVYTSTGTAGVTSGVAATYNGGNGVGNGTTTTGSYGYAVGTGTTNPTGLAIDGSNDVFISTITAVNAPTSVCTTGKTNISIGNYKGIITFVGGSASNVNGTFTAGSPFILALDSGTLDNVSVNGAATAIPGSPFVWSNGYDNAYVGEAYSSSGGGTVSQGCDTPVASNGAVSSYGIGGANASGIVTTIPVANGTLFPAVASDPITGMIATNNEYGLTTDGLGNTWVSSLGAVDTNSDAKYVLTKIVPNYGSSTTTAAAGFTSANFASNATYVEYHDIAGLNSAVTGSAEEARFITTDGGGNIWWAFNTGFIGAISNTGTAISSAYVSGTASGFAGTSCPSSTTCHFTGTSVTYSRVANPKQPQVDPSGNVWVPVQSGPWPNLTVLIGAAVPLASPSSSALAAGKYGQKP
jgi:hypothetical protein